MQTIAVELGDRSYPIHVGDGLLGETNQLKTLITPIIRGQQVVIITNERVYELYGESVQAALLDYDVDVFVMGDGERYKNIETYTAAMPSLFSVEHTK